jgi:hypothetical protein
MDIPLQTSFIPKQTITGSQPSAAPVTNTSSTNIALVVSLVILFLSALLAGGAFAYQRYLLHRLYSPCQEVSRLQPSDQPVGESLNRCGGLYFILEAEKSSLQVDLLSRMERLDAKMKAASTILRNHSSLVPVFDLLSSTTLKTIRYTHFSLTGTTVALDGSANNYEAIAVQSNVLNTAKAAGLISEPIVSDLDLDAKGNVVFHVTFSLNPGLTNYSAVVNKQPGL